MAGQPVPDGQPAAGGPLRHPEGTRSTRRARWRAEVTEATATGQEPPDWRPRKDRGTKYGAADPRSGEERRQADRRGRDLTGEELRRKLAELGREDQRRAHRRGSGDRRR